MRDNVPSASYSSVCNVLRQWSFSLIPTSRVYELYDNPLVRYTSMLSAYSSVGCIVLSRMTHPLLGGCALQRSHVHNILVMCNSKLQGIYENGNHGRAVDSRYVAHNLTSFITKTA